MLHLKHLGYNGDDFQLMLPPIGTALDCTPVVCRFDLDKGEYVGVPTENDIIKLGETAVASAWEAQRLVQLHDIVSTRLHLVRGGELWNWYSCVDDWSL